MALRLARYHADRIDRLVLMGSVGVPFEISEGLDRVWGYEPSVENMKEVLHTFVHNQERIDDELARFIETWRKDHAYNPRAAGGKGR